MAKTKTELGNALKQLTHEKSFDRISVSDITTKCNLNRQTFYYHFQDKYECLEWVYRHDCLLPLSNNVNPDNWEKCLEKVLMIMASDKEFYMQTIKDNPRVFMNLFMSETSNLFRDMIHTYRKKRSHDVDNEFVSEFLAMGVMGMVMNWVDKGMKTSPFVLSEQLKYMADRMRELRDN